MNKKCEKILKELETEGKLKVWWDFKFPEKEELKLRLKDMLEDEVDEKYYLSDEQVKRIKLSTYNVSKTRIQEKEYCDTLCARDWKDPKCVRIGGIFDTEKSKHQAGSIYDKEGLSPTLDVMQGGWRQPSIVERTPLKFLNRNQKNIEGDYAFCVDSSNTGGIKEIENNNCRIRKLTPKECWRLMGFNDEDFEKAQNVPMSNTQLYKQARKFNRG